MSRMTSLLSLASILCGVAACGGGGGDGAAAGSIAPPVQLAAISSQSGPVISAAVAGSMSSSENLSGLGGLAVPTIAQATIGLETTDAFRPPIAALTIGPEAIDCNGGGSASFSGEVNDPLTLTTGDTLSFTYADCADGTGTVIDGSMSLTVSAVTGDISLGTFTFALTMDLQNFQIIDNGTGGALDGDISFALDATSQQAISITISSNMLTATAANQAVTISNYNVSVTIDPLLGSVSLESSGTVTSSDFTGQISYTTTQPVIFNSADVPTSGQVVVNGAEGATITINIVSDTQIDLEFDYDGNGTVDEVVMTTWQELND